MKDEHPQEEVVKEEDRSASCMAHVRRVFAISDLHTDDANNFQWLKDICYGGTLVEDMDLPGEEDALIVAGDISHDMTRLRETLQVLKEGLKCEVFFVSGNHEAWTVREPGLDGCSIAKLEAIDQLCHELGIVTNAKLLGSTHDFPVWVLPMNSWYDGSLALPGCEKHCEDFPNWPWVDFVRCKWPEDFSRSPKDTANLRIPFKLVEYFLDQNNADISLIKSYFGRNNSKTKATGLISFTHFLPNQQSLPDWCEPKSNEFCEGWFDHGAPGVSSKFAKVAGSSLIDKQIRSICTDDQKPLDQLHVFGHSHRPKDFIKDEIRYIHNPLGKPREREDMRMISQNVQFKKVWDTSTGEVSAEKQIIRYWEENGGGRRAVWRYMLRRKETRQKVIKNIRTAISGVSSGR